MRNLRRGPLSVSKDFKFSFNLTWDPPVYFIQSGCQVLQRKYSIRYGDPTKFSPCFGPFCSLIPKQWGTVMSIEVGKAMSLYRISQGAIEDMNATFEWHKMYNIFYKQFLGKKKVYTLSSYPWYPRFSKTQTPGVPLTYFTDGEVRRIFLGLKFWPKGISLGL